MSSQLVSAAPGTAAAPVPLPPGLSTEHLLRRVTYGATPTLRTEVATVGVGAWLAAQLAPASVADPTGQAVLARYPDLAWTTTQAYQRLAGTTDNWSLMAHLTEAHVGRALFSKRQLLEVMVDFWSNHLNVACPSDSVWNTRHRFDADVVRVNALGRFSAMLAASAVHPAMLTYLDNASSTGVDPNENYARELLELHTVGIGNHTETDVKQAALLLSGWTVDKYGVARCLPARHHVGPVTVLGKTFPNATAAGGAAAVRALTDHLATRPATAALLARKLAVRFICDDPPAALVDRLAAVYLSAGTAIVPVLQALFTSPEFTSAEFAASAGAKIRRPFERLVATARALGVGLGTNPAGLRDLSRALDASGHRPLAWGPPNGYPDVAAAWLSPAIALEQYNQTANLVNGWAPKTLVLPAVTSLVSPGPRTAAEAANRLSQRFFGRPATSVELDAVLSLHRAAGLPTGFANGSFTQKRALVLATQLLLCSPTHLTR